MRFADKKRIIRKLAAKDASEAIRITGRVWELAEPGFKENESAKLVAEFKKGIRGFKYDPLIRKRQRPFTG